MHGNRVISEYAPDGRTSETIFATSGLSVGIQQGVTIALLARIDGRGPCVVRYRDDLDQARAEERRRALVESLNDPDAEERYVTASPSPANRYSFRPQAVTADYASWPRLVELADVALQRPEREAQGRLDLDRSCAARGADASLSRPGPVVRDGPGDREAVQ